MSNSTSTSTKPEGGPSSSSPPPARSAPSAPAATIPPSPPTSANDETAALSALSEREKMVRGLPYLAMVDDSLLHARLAVRKHMQAYNTYPWPEPPADYFGPDDRMDLLAKVFGMTLDEIKGRPIEIEPPFYVDYGDNVKFLGSFYANMDLILLDGAPITIGTRVLCGPRVGLYAATHSTDVDERQGGYERAYPIEIGEDCWIGGGAIINGPSKIGKGCTIAAGAVVRGEFPDYCVIGGVPGRILKRLEPPKGVHDLDKYR